MVMNWPGTTRKIIRIDEDTCTGCGECIPDCPEGALRIVDGKARLISESLCDGLGACVGRCPTGAMTVEERQVEEYNEEEVMENIIDKGLDVTRAHLQHLKDHREDELYSQALAFLRKRGIENPLAETSVEACTGGCPGSAVVKLDHKDNNGRTEQTRSRGKDSCLGNWPVQIKLVPTNAPYLKDADVLLAADCVPCAYPNFHEHFLRDKVLLVGCPKLDDTEFYVEKLAAIFKTNKIRSMTCVHMEVPCCTGLVNIGKTALATLENPIPFFDVTIGIHGDIVEH